MPIFYVTMRYRVAETFRVEAADDADARRKVSEGEGESVCDDVVPGSTQASDKWTVKPGPAGDPP